jgi:hypothetical protein
MRPRNVWPLLLCCAAAGCAAPAFTEGGTGFWISLWWPTATGALALLFGAFCALWAQNTGRNAWLWFFLGLVFHVFAIGVLLYRNAEAGGRRTGPGTTNGRA